MCITIILVALARARNIGAAARAIKTMGFSELWAVDDQAHLESTTRWIAHGFDDITDSIKVFPTLVESLHDVDFTVTTATRSQAKYHHYAMSVELASLPEEKSLWMSHAALVFDREDSGLTNEELTLADVLTGASTVADYPSFSLGQTMMVHYYQLATLIQRSVKNGATADQHQLQVLRKRVVVLLTALAVIDDIELVN